MRYQIDNGGFAPERAHPTDAGLDLRSPIDAIIPARSSLAIDTGIHIQLPHNSVGFLKSKSGLNVKHCILSEGVIDEGYTGPIVVKLYNHSDKDYEVRRGDKITQLVVLPVYYVGLVEEEIPTSERGNDGFGSTGR